MIFCDFQNRSSTHVGMECIELVGGLPNNINGEELENAVVKIFQVAGINIRRRNFHAVHRLADLKLTNRHDTIIAILR